MMNYPADNRLVGKRSWVKIKFNSKELFEKHVDKLKNSNHIESVIVAGDWKLAPSGSKHHSECIIYKKRNFAMLQNIKNHVTIHGS